MLSNETVKVLNDLIQISEDGKKGFAEAARDATASELKTLFTKCSTDCGLAVTELQGFVKSLGGEAQASGTISGAANRGWTRMKAMVGDANIAVLEQVEHAEDTAKQAYAKALGDTSLTKLVRDAVKRQQEGVVRNHDAIRSLRNRYKAEKEAVAS